MGSKKPGLIANTRKASDEAGYLLVWGFVLGSDPSIWVSSNYPVFSLFIIIKYKAVTFEYLVTKLAGILGVHL